MDPGASADRDMAANVALIATLSQAMSAELVGYPPGIHEVIPPLPAHTQSSTPLPEGLFELYALCDGIDLPELHTGCWIHPGEWIVAKASDPFEPNVIASSGAQVTVFGSDGGGSRFVLEHATGAVLRLPSTGAVHDGVFVDTSDSTPTLLADSMAGFMMRLREDLQAFVRQDTSWSYLAT